MVLNTPQPVTLKEALQYDADSLEAGIGKCLANIQLFEETIANERQTIDRYNQMIALIKSHKQG